MLSFLVLINELKCQKLNILIIKTFGSKMQDLFLGCHTPNPKKMLFVGFAKKTLDFPTWESGL